MTQRSFLQRKQRQGNTGAFILTKKEVTSRANLCWESTAPTGTRCCQLSADAVSSWEPHA